MTYKLLAIDIDGTLHTSNREVPHPIPPLLRDIENGGVIVMLCTGRRYRTTLPIYESLGLRGPIGLHSGALVMEPVSGKRLAAEYLDAATAGRACTLMRHSGLQPLVWEDNFPDSPDILSSADYTGFTKKYTLRHSEFIENVEDISDLSSPRILEIGAWGKFDELIEVNDVLASELGNAALLHISKNIIDDYCILEALSPRAGKWRAVWKLARDKGINRSEIVAIGDNYNDIDLIKGAGYGVAMGNAVDEAKAAADHITAGNDEEGLFKVLKKLFG